jgi:exosome complex component MTR3
LISGDLPIIISCASLALADAGIMIYDLVTSVSVVWPHILSALQCVHLKTRHLNLKTIHSLLLCQSCFGKNIIIDPTSDEEAWQDGSIMVAYMPARKEITQLTLTGEWSDGKITNVCVFPVTSTYDTKTV